MSTASPSPRPASTNWWPAGMRSSCRPGAGLGSAITDEEYRAAGARIEPTAEATWASGELVLKVKEPVGDESNFLHDGLVLFTYLHLAADRPLTEQLLASGTTALGYETVQLSSGMLPLLLPRAVVGCLAPQLGAYSLMKPHGGVVCCWCRRREEPASGRAGRGGRQNL